MPFVIETDCLVKKYGQKAAVDNVSLHLQAGDIYGLIGKNGAGKTTLMRLILGLTPADEGTVRLFDGENVYSARRRIGSIVEEPGLYYGKTAFENMKTFSLLYDDVSDDDIRALLAKAGLSGTGSKKVKEFSLGMRQRLGLAVALMGNPELLVLDEPVNGLDPTGIKEIRDMILEMNARGISFMISSHLLDELGKIATKFGIMANGRLVEEISAEELKNRCRKHISVSVDRTEDAVRFLRENFENMEIQNGEDAGSLKIISGTDDTSEISRVLVSAGIKLYSVCLQGATVEEYFLRRTETES